MWGLPRTFTCTYCKHSLTSVSNHYICSWNSSIKHGNPRKLTQSTMLQLLVSSFEGGTLCGHDLWLLSWTLHTHTGHLLCGIITINHVCSSSKYPRTVAGSSIWSPRSREDHEDLTIRRSVHSKHAGSLTLSLPGASPDHLTHLLPPAFI